MDQGKNGWTAGKERLNCSFDWKAYPLTATIFVGPTPSQQQGISGTTWVLRGPNECDRLDGKW